MAISLRPVSVIGSNGNRLQELFAQLVFSGNYATGGDTITVDETDAPSYTKGFLETLMLPVGLPPSIFLFVSGVSGSTYTFTLIAGSKATDFLIKVFTGGAELVAGAYPAALTAATDIFIDLKYKTAL